MAADGPIAFSDIDPTDVVPQVEKDANCALVRAFGEDDLITFAKLRMSRVELRLHKSNVGHLHATRLRPEPGLIHKSRFLKIGSHGFLFSGLAGGLPLRRLLGVEPLRFQRGGLGRPLKAL